jgi:hypothetical protein
MPSQPRQRHSPLGLPANAKFQTYFVILLTYYKSEVTQKGKKANKTLLIQLLRIFFLCILF